MTASATAASAPALARAAPRRFGVVRRCRRRSSCCARPAGWVFPRWLTFLLTMAAGNGLVSLGIVALMRGGVVPFGQGMVFAAGGYTAALVYNKLGFTDALGLAVCGGVAAVLVAAPFAPLLSRYRGIFFAMLTLALSMVTLWPPDAASPDALGGSDGFKVGRSTLFGQKLADDRVGYTLYVLTVSVATVAAVAMRICFDSTRGLVTLAVRENELRVEYLGGSVRHAMAINFAIAAFCGGLGGALVVLSLGHIEPNFSYWTTSGEFGFVAILAGWQSVAAASPAPCSRSSACSRARTSRTPVAPRWACSCSS